MFLSRFRSRVHHSPPVWMLTEARTVGTILTRRHARQTVQLTSKLNHGQSSGTKNHSGSVRGGVLWKTVGDFRYTPCTVSSGLFGFFFYPSEAGFFAVSLRCCLTR